MKIEREFANMVGGADPGGPGYSNANILAVSVRIRLDSGPGSPSQGNKRRRKKSVGRKTSKAEP